MAPPRLTPSMALSSTRVQEGSMTQVLLMTPTSLLSPSPAPSRLHTHAPQTRRYCKFPHCAKCRLTQVALKLSFPPPLILRLLGPLNPLSPAISSLALRFPSSVTKHSFLLDYNLHLLPIPLPVYGPSLRPASEPGLLSDSQPLTEGLIGIKCQ